MAKARNNKAHRLAGFLRRGMRWSWMGGGMATSNKKPPRGRLVGCGAAPFRRRQRCIRLGEALGPASASLLQGSEVPASARLLGMQADTGLRRKEKSWRISFWSLGTIAVVLCLSNVLCSYMVDFFCEDAVTYTNRYSLSKTCFGAVIHRIRRGALLELHRAWLCGARRRH